MIALHYIACFFAGAFFANVVPHFVHGISGDPFPSPFATPRGIGLSSPTVNVVWALVNLVAGYLLFRHAHLAALQPADLLVFFAGIAVLSIQMSMHFRSKHTS
ncbi:MAG: hypothetical protein PW789_08615 [Edaphobacter sp.]|uniref:hypothetical protein n=1 Tax=Edaphobacter sp. TaxID=1934404 RepID=UPI0023967483|nr:hypothetical protein [Edaphobacter sp.]MDE1176657.1 hypothetical protein [Edaphobacter sp.]